MASIDVNAFTTPFQLTKSMRREMCASLEPTHPGLNASGKVVLITGAGGKIGGVSNANSILSALRRFALTLNFLEINGPLDRTPRLRGAKRARLESFLSAVDWMTCKGPQRESKRSAAAAKPSSAAATRPLTRRSKLYMRTSANTSTRSTS